MSNDKKAAKEEKKDDQDRRFGREIAYGIQQTIACWATDFIDPPVSAFLQNKFGNKKHTVTNVHTFGGEFIGDSAALGVYLFAKRMFRKPIDGVIAAVKNAGAPIFDRIGKGAINIWANAHDVHAGDARYEQKLDEYKNFQAENLVDSGIISVAATGINVMAQRQLGNKQSYATILGSKMVGATLTLGLMGGLRLLLPTSTKALDDEITDRYTARVVRGAKKILGVKESPVVAPAPLETPADASLPSELAPEKRAGLLKIMLEKAEKTDVFDDALAAKMLGESKEVFTAMKAALEENGYLANVMAREHYDQIEHAMRYDYDHANPEHALLYKEASRASVEQSLAEKRRDLDLIMALLGDAKFLADIRHAVKHKTAFEIHPTEMSEAHKNQLSEFLLSNRSNAKDPAFAILDAAEKHEAHHQALAHTLDPDGIVGRIFESEMLKRLPAWEAKEVRGIAKDYMQYYHHEAQRMADHFKADSSVVKHAAQRARQLRSKFMPENSPQSALSA